jgi:hypothetical protein
VHRAAHRLWADRHNISVSSLREGWGRHLASGVNLLTFDAIPKDEPRCSVLGTLIVAFSQRLGLQVGARSRQNPTHEKSGQMVANGAGGAGRELRGTELAPRCAGGAGINPTIGGRWIPADAGAARHVAASGLRLVGPLELHVTSQG